VSVARAADSATLAGCLLPAQLAWLATQAVPDIAPRRAVTLLEAAVAVDTTSCSTRFEDDVPSEMRG
jgi:hypothetical protein